MIRTSLSHLQRWLDGTDKRSDAMRIKCRQEGEGEVHERGREGRREGGRERNGKREILERQSEDERPGTDGTPQVERDGNS